MIPQKNAVDNEDGYIKNRNKLHSQLPVGLTARASHPRNALIELTNGCNHACIFCKNSNQERKATFLPLEIYKSFVEQAVELGLEEVGLYATGEPFMTKNLEEYIRTAKTAGVTRVYLTTNGALASLNKVKSCVDAGLDSIKFSINASNSTDYKLVHGFDDFDKVCDNVKSVYRWKKNNKINLQMLCSCVTIPAIGNIEKHHRDLFSEYFEDILYLEAGSQAGQANDLIEQLSVSPHGVFSNIGKVNSPAEIKPCPIVWNRYHLTAEGYLTGCCVDYELDLVYSDLKKETLKQGWNNDTALKLRTSHIENNLDGLICHQCLLNTKKPYTSLTDVHKIKKSESIRNKERDVLKNRMVITIKPVL